MIISTMQANFETGIKPVWLSVAETRTAIFFPLTQGNSGEKMVTWATRSFFWNGFMETQAVFDTHTIFFNGGVWVGWRHMKSSKIHINIQHGHGETLSFPFYCLLLIN